MRRGRKYLRAFGHGLMLTGLPALAFLAFDYLVTPPSNGVAVDTARRASAIDRSRDVVADVKADQMEPAADIPAEAKGVSPAAIKSLIKSAVAEATSGGRSSLVTSIQTELRRVGCYAGDADGAWNDQTQAALTAFNSSVHVNLPTDRPDYIHLTLLQGHSAKACSRSCDGDLAHANSCAGRSIEARSPASPSQSTAAHPVRAGDQAHAASVVVPTQVLIQKSPSTTIVKVAPSQAAAGSVVVRRGAESPSAGPAPVAVSVPAARDGVASSAPLPGRMAIGVPDASAGLPGENPAVASTPELTVEGEAHKAKSGVAQSRPRPAAAAATSSRVNRMFSDLSSNSP